MSVGNPQIATCRGSEIHDLTTEQSFSQKTWNSGAIESYLNVRNFTLEFKCCILRETENYLTFFPCFV